MPSYRTELFLILVDFTTASLVRDMFSNQLLIVKQTIHVAKQPC